MKKTQQLITIILFSLLSITLLIINVKDDSSITFQNRETLFSIQETDDGPVLQSEPLNLWPAGYHIRMEYDAPLDDTIIVTANKTELYRNTLAAGTGEIFEFSFTLADKTDNLYISLSETVSPASVHSLTLSSDRLLYTDTIITGIFLYLAGLLLIFFLGSSFFRTSSLPQKLLWGALLGAFFYSLLPLLRSTLSTGYDIAFHLDRIEEIKNGIYERQFPVFIYPKNCNGFGLMGGLYPDLLLYFGAFFRIFHMSLVGSYKLMVVFAQLAGALIMYLSVRSINRSDHAAALSGILMLLFPYRLINMYYRNALGEVLAMIFFPLVAASLYHIVCGNHKKAWKWLVAGYSGIFQSHILACVLAVMLTAVILLTFPKELFRKERLTSFFKAVAGTILVNLWYIVPFLTFYADGFNADALVGDFAGNGVTALQLFGITGGWIMGVIGIFGLFCLLFLLLSFLPQKCFAAKENDIITGSFVQYIRLVRCLSLLGILSAIMATDLFPWRFLTGFRAISIVTDMLQFPYRFLTLTAFAFAMAVPLLLFSVKKMYYVKGSMLAVLILSAVYSGKNMIMNTIPANENAGLTKVFGGINDIHWPEYWPKGATDACYRYDSLFYSSETFQFPRYEKNGTHILCQYQVMEDGNYIEFPLFYYIGYRATLTPEGSKKASALPIERGSEYRLRVYVPKSETPSIIKISYTGTWYFHLAMIISAASLTGFIIYQLPAVRKKCRL